MSGRNKCNFSIEHILNVAGNSPSKPQDLQLTPLNYDWLNCTRYRPPRIQRPKKKEGTQRRNPGRNPRIPFSPSQVALLESKFQRTPYLSSHEVQQVASSLQLSETRIKIWFQNRRARERRDIEPKESKGNESPSTETSKQLPLVENESINTEPENLKISKTCETRPSVKQTLPSPYLIPFPVYSRDHVMNLTWLFKNS